jgi:hypothetical protein
LIQDGKFALLSAHGLLPGTYRVEISSPKAVAVSPADYAAGQAPSTIEDLIPAQYNTESALTIEVIAGGDNQFNFRLP